MTKLKRNLARRRCGSMLEALEQRRLLSAGLAVTYATSPTDVSGLSTLSYNGVQLINDSTYQQQFQVSRYYTLNSDGTYSIGTSSLTSTNWNASAHTLTYNYAWGNLTCQYVQAGNNRLNLVFAVNNNASSGVTLGGLNIIPAYIHFPFTITPTDEQQIQNNPSPATPLWSPEVAYGIDGPAVEPADYSDAPTDDGAVMALANDGPASQQMYTALWTTNYNGSTAGKDYYILAATAPTAIMLGDQADDPTTYTPPIFYTNTAPGQSDNFEISLRFGAAGTNPLSLATDIEQQYNQTYPALPVWPDRRPIASLHIASEGSNTSTNPNAWALGSYATAPIDVTTTSGLNAFSSYLMNYASGAISRMGQDNSQGMIVWDVEGEQYPQPNPSYIGDPSQIPTIAPELDYNYNNNGPLINQFFSAFTNAGFRVGVTLRPTSIVYSNGVPQQTPNDGVGSVPISQEITKLETKIAYAYKRWGCTLFYIDSTTGFDSAALRTVQEAYPNVLLIPEHNTTSTFGTGAPYGELTNEYVGTPSSARYTYSSAFSVIYIADGNMSTYASELLSSLAQGDIMLFRAWFNDPNNATMLSDYQAVFPVPGQTSVSASPGDAVVNLSWALLGNEAVYNIARSTSANGPFSPLAYGVFGPSYADTTVINYQKYFYEITAVNGAGTGPASSVVSAIPVGVSVVSPAAASPAVITGMSTNLSVSGNDQNYSSSTLTYTWSSFANPANVPPATFSINGTNLAQNTTAHFYQAGTYILTAKITDPGGYYATSSTTVVVGQTVTQMYVLPAKITLAGGGTQQYTVRATDQYSNIISSPPVTWSVSGGGAINSSSGLYTANVTGGTYVVTATSGSFIATTSVTVQAIGPGAQPNVVQTAVSSITSTNLYNVGSNDLIVPDGGASAVVTITAELKAGYNAGHGYWNGSSGIISSSAANDTTYLTAVGVILNNDGNTNNPDPLYNTFDGKPVALNDVLIKYTYYGDADLNGIIDGSDYSLIDNGYPRHLSGWSNGDFNYDGVINGSDYTLIDNAFNRQSPVGSVSPAAIVNSAVKAKPASSFAAINSAATPSVFSSTPIQAAPQSGDTIDALLDAWE